MEDLGQQVQSMFKTIYEATDRKYIRPIKRHMFQCGMGCLDDKNTISKAEECIDDCGKPMKQAMYIVQTEINAFQGRIDRCLMNCQDDVRHERDEAKAKKLFDSCAEKCIKEFNPHVAEVIKVMTGKLDDLKKEYNLR